MTVNEEMLAALRRAAPWLGKMIADGAHKNAVMPGDCVRTLQMVERAIMRADGADEANARLIAAAPEMYEFIAQISRMLPYCYEEGCKDDENHTHGGVTPDGSWTDDQAEDAISVMNQLIEAARALRERVK